MVLPYDGQETKVELENRGVIDGYKCKFNFLCEEYFTISSNLPVDEFGSQT